MGKDTITFKFSREALHTDGARIVGNAFYDLAATLFEWGGERNLDENGKRACDVHGHHTAQRISEYAVSLWEGKPHPLQADLGRLSAEIAELRATLLNERGKGDPPKGGWKPYRFYGVGKFIPGWVSGNIVVARGLDLWHAYTVEGGIYEPMLDASGDFVEAPTARATMALAAKIALLGDDGGPMV